MMRELDTPQTGSDIPDATTMSSRPQSPRVLLPAISAAIPVLLLYVSGLSLILTLAESFALSATQTSSLIIGLHAVRAALSIIVTFIISAVVACHEEAGKHEKRYLSVFVVTIGMFGIAFMAGVAAQLPTVIPFSLLLALAGLGLLGVLGQALSEITRGPLRLGPLFAFVVASSQMSLLGFGSLFWALVVGMAVTLLLEQQELLALRTAA